LDYKRASVTEIKDAITSRETSCEDYITSLLESIEKKDKTIHAYITLNRERAIEEAKVIDSMVKDGRRVGRLVGIAVAVKDNICTSGIRTTCASKILENFVPPYDATVVSRIKSENGIVIGKTNMDEFAMGNSTSTSYFGPVTNPWKEGYTSGGSSGGSAATVSTRLATLALGSDTGGSIRCPSSFCSVVGLKPTYGLVSRYGLIAYGNSLEQIGPIANSVSDCALFLDVIASPDGRDSTSVAPKETKHSALRNKLKGVKIAVPKEWTGEGTQETVKRVFWRAMDKLEEAGARWSEISIASLGFSLAAYYILAMAEASSNLARYDGVRYGLSHAKLTGDWNEVYSKTRSEGFGPEVKRRIMLGSFVLSAGYFEAYYLKAQKVRTVLKREFAKVLGNFDLIAGPTMPVLPFRLGQVPSPLETYRIDVNTVLANLTGLPAISVPAGFAQGLPIGLQLHAAPFGEHLLLSAAHAFESAADLQNLPPRC
jgi:aspartyl-tRNA(Asn)/glutamyl-tRNA(Gln) amidotransferase subunit A